MISKPRPKYLNLFAIRLPIPGIVSILHRISGFLMVALLGFFIIDQLITSLIVIQEFPFSLITYIKVFLIVPIWALSHHLLLVFDFYS